VALGIATNEILGLITHDRSIRVRFSSEAKNTALACPPSLMAATGTKRKFSVASLTSAFEHIFKTPPAHCSDVSN